MASTVYQHFLKSAEVYTDRPFLHIVSDTADRYGMKPGSISYSEAYQEIRRLARAYSVFNIEEGQRVAIGLDNRPECFYHWLALNALGISVVPLNPAWQSAELEYVLDHSEVWMVGGRQDQKIPDAAIDRNAEVPVLLKAGDCSFHHSLLLHRSGPNNTDQFRRGMASHYMSARSRWTGKPEDKPHYPLVRGQDYAGCA